MIYKLGNGTTFGKCQHTMFKDNQFHLFIQTMKNNSIEIMDLDKNDYNPLQLWIKLGVN